MLAAPRVHPVLQALTRARTHAVRGLLQRHDQEQELLLLVLRIALRAQHLVGDRHASAGRPDRRQHLLIPWWQTRIFPFLGPPPNLSTVRARVMMSCAARRHGSTSVPSPNKQQKQHRVLVAWRRVAFKSSVQRFSSAQHLVQFLPLSVLYCLCRMGSGQKKEEPADANLERSRSPTPPARRRRHCSFAQHAPM